MFWKKISNFHPFSKLHFKNWEVMKEPPDRKWRSRHASTRCCAQMLLAACVMQNIVPFTIYYGDPFIHHCAACSLCAVLLAISFISSVGDHCFEKLRVTYLLSKLHLIVGQMLFLVANFDAKYYFRVRHWNWYPRFGSLRISWTVPVSCSLQISISSMRWRFLTKTLGFQKSWRYCWFCSLSNVVHFVIGYRCWSAGKLVEKHSWLYRSRLALIVVFFEAGARVNWSFRNRRQDAWRNVFSHICLGCSYTHYV